MGQILREKMRINIQDGKISAMISMILSALGVIRFNGIISSRECIAKKSLGLLTRTVIILLIAPRKMGISVLREYMMEVYT